MLGFRPMFWRRFFCVFLCVWLFILWAILFVCWEVIFVWLGVFYCFIVVPFLWSLLMLLLLLLLLLSLFLVLLLLYFIVYFLLVVIIVDWLFTNVLFSGCCILFFLFLLDVVFLLFWFRFMLCFCLHAFGFRHNYVVFILWGFVWLVSPLSTLLPRVQNMFGSGLFETDILELMKATMLRTSTKPLF